ncbi:type II toxin-antitoxin system VapC family toxin [Microbacterium sp.]|uniref:type II toxin-antitoxin system VapC family toxin n=1 Tax=Microbacterium sp. TaxID=51671 RepID=UPI0039E28DC8
MIVLDASALLAFLQAEPGADQVEDALEGGATIGAANYAEVAQKVSSGGASWPIVRALLDSYSLSVESVTREDGERAAALWRAGSGLSLGDRLCIVLGDRLDLDVLTADSAWGDAGRIRQIR